jgi:hypothetical protein
MINLLEKISWPANHLDHKGVQRWTSLHGEPPEAIVVSAVQKNDAVEFRVRSVSMTGEDEHQFIAFSRWERKPDGFALTERRGHGMDLPLDESTALREFQAYVVLTNARPTFQMTGVVKPGLESNPVAAGTAAP